MTKLSVLVGSICLVLAASLGAAVSAGATAQTSVTSAQQPAAAKKWKAPSGPFFNDPHRRDGHFRIERKVIDTINRTPKGSTIRIAIYSLDRLSVSRALVAAHRRGVQVQMLLNDHWENGAVRVLRAEVGKDPRRNSFVYKCRQSCRGAANEFNNLHSKFYLFSQAGRSKDVVAVGSANMTRNAAVHQWNDLYFTDGDHELFRQMVGLFNDMRKDYDTRQEPIAFCGVPLAGVCDDSIDKHTVVAFPRASGPKNDLVLTMLDRVQCRTADPVTGTITRTRLALSMHTMRGERGDYLAAAIRNKYAQGCDVRVTYGLIGFHTKGVLGAPTPRGRIPLRSTGLDYDLDDNFDLNNDGVDDLILDYYSHQKYLIIQGTYNKVPDAQMVLTGSVNWSSLSTANDEVWFTVRGATVAKKYLANYDYQWNNTRNTRNAYTTTYANFRVQRTVRDADGTTRRIWTTVRRPVTTIERDPYAKGPYWEND
ncbi:Phosphatidylserine/phosphatidylglycerophosphate/cardiolipin synthase [Nocardioides alpinus]|uniref:phospholipase D n=1 Tax=Nocardioides alpinus TaxID=748909 RepID=A0A1I1AV90_9ACTN|nr:phospholipase D-like domain-containing protein [Nocardioides alpinus]SFB41999.1 Phosphatidylserine/phosphatidylglycerophosphate/cardiolipin synthase [Nocardioides alpinus]